MACYKNGCRSPKSGDFGLRSKTAFGGEDASEVKYPLCPFVPACPALLFRGIVVRFFRLRKS